MKNDNMFSMVNLGVHFFHNFEYLPLISFGHTHEIIYWDMNFLFTN